MALPLTKPATKTIPPIGDETALVAVAKRDPAESSITVYAMVKKRERANRTWEMNEVGITVMCLVRERPGVPRARHRLPPIRRCGRADEKFVQAVSARIPRAGEKGAFFPNPPGAAVQ